MTINVVLALMIIGSFLVAIIIHESGHALAASLLGDPTPRSERRLSLSLPAHLDPVGTLMCVLLAFFPITAASSRFGLGKACQSRPLETARWAKWRNPLGEPGRHLDQPGCGIAFRRGAAFHASFPCSVTHITLRIPQLIARICEYQYLPGDLQPDPAVSTRWIPDSVLTSAQSPGGVVCQVCPVWAVYYPGDSVSLAFPGAVVGTWRPVHFSYPVLYSVGSL